MSKILLVEDDDSLGASLKGYLTDLEQVSALAEKLSSQLPADNLVVTEFVQLKTDLDLTFLQEDLQDLVKESIEGATRAKKIVQDLRDFSRIDKQDKEILILKEGEGCTNEEIGEILELSISAVKSRLHRARFS